MTSFTVIIPIWLVWVIVGALVVNTILTVISIRLRLQAMSLLRGGKGTG